MQPLLALFALCILLLFLVGAICGIVAVARLAHFNREVSGLASRLRSLELQVRDFVSPPPPPLAKPAARTWPETPAPEPERAPAAPAGPDEAKPVSVAPAAKAPSQSLPPPPQVPTVGENTWEVSLGTKWLGWGGALLVLVGLGLFLKLAYDRGLIPPEGRLAIGALAGVAALGLGQHFRRKQWNPLFQTLTGVGIADFYLCVFFSFHIYSLTGQSVSFALAVLVTALAVVMAVAHDALPIAILGVLGGFLSPVIFTAGGNHPYSLFSYLIVVDLVAVGAAYFRRWRALDLFCFLGTTILYQSWYVSYYRAPDQMFPALLFASVFYVLFLAVPTLYSLTRRLPEGVDGMALVVLNAVFSFFAYYNILYHECRQALGFVVLAQALLVFLLFQAWRARVSRDSRTAQSLLVIALALVTIAIPIQLKMYGIPIGWAAEGVLFVWLGFRFRERLVRLGGAVALVLATGGLIHRLPLHRLPFTPVFNSAFGSWCVVIAATVGAAGLFHRNRDTAPEPTSSWQPPDRAVGALVGLLAFGLAAALLSMECALFWTTRRMANFRNYECDSLVVLWTLVAMAVSETIARKRLAQAAPLAAFCFGVGALIFLAGLAEYDHPTPILALNATFLSKAAFIAALWWAAWTLRRIELGTDKRPIALAFEVAGNVLLTALLAFEFNRWSHHTELISSRMGLALISAAWAVQAFVLIWVGLMMRKKPLRILGFLLFGMTCFKVIAVDTSQLEQLYRIVSCMATGVFLLLATWLYHRYSAILMGPPPLGDDGPLKDERP